MRGKITTSMQTNLSSSKRDIAVQCFPGRWVQFHVNCFAGSYILCIECSVFFFVLLILIPLSSVVDVWRYTPPCGSVIQFLTRHSLISDIIPHTVQPSSHRSPASYFQSHCLPSYTVLLCAYHLNLLSLTFFETSSTFVVPYFFHLLPCRAFHFAHPSCVTSKCIQQVKYVVNVVTIVYVSLYVNCICRQGKGHSDEARRLHECSQATSVPGWSAWWGHEPTHGDDQDRPYDRHRTDVDTQLSVSTLLT